MEDTNELLEQLLMQQLSLEMKDVTIDFQKDGLTNQNFIVSHNNMKYAVRISGDKASNLGIRRRAEYAAMKEVESFGIGAELIYFSIESGNMITKFISGSKWSDEDIKTPELIKSIANTMVKYHHATAIPYEFSPYQDIRDRIDYAKKNQIDIPDQIDDYMQKLKEIEAIRAGYGHKYSGLCHNDVFANNFIYDGSVRLIDWEYAGMGDIFFDFACICMRYSQEEKELFLQSYFGKCNKELLDGLDQMFYVSYFWNATWALVQSATTGTAIDYKGMAGFMFSRMNHWITG